MMFHNTNPATAFQQLFAPFNYFFIPLVNCWYFWMFHPLKEQ